MSERLLCFVYVQERIKEYIIHLIVIMKEFIYACNSCHVSDGPTIIDKYSTI